MIKTERPSFSFSINSRPVTKFKGQKTYVSTGDSDDMDNGELVTYSNRPSRANVQPKIGDVIFAKMANTSKTFLVDDRLSKMIFSTGFFDISSDKLDNRFLYYLIQSDEFDGYKNAYSEGTTQVSISDKRLKRISITFEGDLKKQKLIASALDCKLSKVESIIHEIEEKQEYLNDLKNNLIDSAVTGALSSENKVETNYSWIGKIPVNWEVRKLRFLGTFQNGISTDSSFFGSGYPFVNYTDVYNNLILPFEVKGLVESRLVDQARLSVKYGDVFFTRTSETIEEIGFAATCLKDIPNAVFSGFLIRFRPFSLAIMNPDFFKYYFRSNIHRHFFVKEMNIVTRCSLGQGLLKNMPVLIPPVIEQIKISEFLDEKCSLIEQLNTTLQKKKSVLNAFRKSVIYEYVSGKKEVA